MPCGKNLVNIVTVTANQDAKGTSNDVSLQIMDSIHLSAVALTLALYSFLAVSYFGWGKAAHSILGIGKSDNRTHTLSIWMGWAFTLFIFQLIHFVLPLTAFTVLPVFMVGFALSVPEIVAACRRCTNTQNYTLLRLVIWTLFVVVILVVSCWIASRSMLHPKNWDSGLYHFNKIRWINSYPVVPGLGNLHGRLAFNQSFFAYVAVLNFYPFFYFSPLRHLQLFRTALSVKH